jgi:hypothetical protein
LSRDAVLQPIDASSRSAPYNCDFGGKWLQIQAIVQVTDREGRTFETITPETMKNATKVSETNLKWKWTTQVGRGHARGLRSLFASGEQEGMWCRCYPSAPGVVSVNGGLDLRGQGTGLNCVPNATLRANSRPVAFPVAKHILDCGSPWQNAGGCSARLAGAGFPRWGPQSG